MNTPSVTVAWINSVEELRTAAGPWDDLWQRSDIAAPTARAEMVAQWVETFAPQSHFHAIVVKDDERFLAALPLVSTRLYGVLGASAIPANGWIPTGGGLLLDRETAAGDVMDRLLHGVADLPHQVLWLDEVALGVARWQAFWNAANRAGMPVSFQERYPAGVIEIDHDWQAYRASWSFTHRRNMRRAYQKLTARGEPRFELLSGLQPDEVERQLQRGFEIENRSWKGEAGSSVMARGVFSYFVRQAKQLAAWGDLRLTFLTLDARPIAFSYGFAGKGVYQTLKIGYDPEYAEFSPGQLLFHDLLERLYHDQRYRRVDTVGLLTQTVAHWRPSRYTVGLAMIAPRRILGRLATFGHKHCWPPLRRLRARLQHTG